MKDDKIIDRSSITSGVRSNKTKSKTVFSQQMDNSKAKQQQRQAKSSNTSVEDNADILFSSFVSGKNVDMQQAPKTPQKKSGAPSQTFKHTTSVPVRPENDASSNSFPLTPKEKAELKRKQKEESIQARKEGRAPRQIDISEIRPSVLINTIEETSLEELAAVIGDSEMNETSAEDEDEEADTSDLKSKSPPGIQHEKQDLIKEKTKKKKKDTSIENIDILDKPVKMYSQPREIKKQKIKILQSEKTKDKLSALRRSRILYEGDIEMVKKRFAPSNIRAALIYMACSLVIIACAVMFVLYLIENNNASTELDDVGNSFTLPETITVEKQIPDMSLSWPPIVDFTALKSQYPDVAAWIRIPGTNVDYPVLTNPEESYYLHRSITGAYSTPGSIFCDAMNTNDLSQQHIVIYGHHMVYASMFHDVSKYNKPDFFAQHRVIYFETPELTYVLQPIAMYYCTPKEVAVRKVLFKNSQAFQQYLDERLQRSDVIKYDDYKRETLDKLVTLITCDATGDNRQIVECVPVQVYKTDMVPSVIARAEEDVKKELGITK